MFRNLKKRKRLLLGLSLFALVFIIAACSQEPIGPESDGFWDGIIIYNFSRAIIWIAEFFGGNYGIGIIVVTIFFRALLIPLTNMQQKNMAQMNEIQPQINELKERYSARDTETQEKLKEEQQRLYDEAGVNPYMGCLPMLVQMPIFIALYQAVNRTPQLATGSFLWVNLGEPDPYFILPILAGVFTLAHSVLMQMGKPESGNKLMTYIMPLFIVFITFSLSSALALYFVVSNGFSAAQTLIFQNPFKMRREREREEEEKQEAERQRRRALKKAQKLGRNIKK